MAFKRFLLSIIARLVVVMLSLSAFSYLVIVPGYHAASLLMFGVSMGFVLSLYAYVSKTNAELTRFLDAARYSDFGQRFRFSHLGAGFEELGETFGAILDRYKEERTERESELRHLKAMVEHVPVPLITVQADGSIHSHNNAARRLFGTTIVSNLSDLDTFGEAFRAGVQSAEPGARTLVPFMVDGMERRLTLATTQVMVGGRPETLISLQDIQNELDGAQLSAWQDLVRVLTHEIMNSITPVASLARTAVDLVDDAKTKAEGNRDLVEELEDVRGAVETVARRSDGLMSFVTSYRRLTHLPAPKRSIFTVADLFDGVERLAAEDPKVRGVTLEVSVDPSGLELNADRDMVEQMLINMIQNAAQALDGSAERRIILSARLSKRGHIVIKVADTGPGIPEEIAAKVFVPFYTTKREGTGVGLALTRQVMIAHGGHARLLKGDERSDEDPAGAVFTLTF